MKINFEKIDKALFQLNSALKNELKNDLERDGVIQRFEYTIELLWKISKKVLQENGISAVVPKEVIRELANIGWINNPDDLMKYLQLRNETSHSYEEEVAQKVYEETKGFAIIASNLVDLLKQKAS